MLDFKTKSSNIIKRFRDHENLLFIGTPCGILSPLFEELDINKEVIYAPREDTAIGVACGFSLKNKKAVVLMQNSGFAQSLNILASLVEPFKIAITLVISMRGIQNDTTRENVIMGEATVSTLEVLKIPYKFLTNDSYISEIDWADEYLQTNQGAVALLITPEFFGWEV